MNALKGYPGRGIFVGRARGKPCFVYIVTGRSIASKKRRACVHESGARIEPLGGRKDELRHYECVRLDGSKAVIANGSHIAALRPAMNAMMLAESLQKAGPEPDAYRTPRIAGIIADGVYLGIVAHAAQAVKIRPTNNTLYGVVTYNGDMRKPAPANLDEVLSVRMAVRSPDALAAEFFNQLDVRLRVCAVTGVFDDEWKLSVRNAASVD